MDTSDHTPGGCSPATGALVPAIWDVNPPFVPSPVTGASAPAIQDMVHGMTLLLQDVLPVQVSSGMEVNSLSPAAIQTTPTEWALSDTEPVPAGLPVILSVWAGVASSMHNPANVMAVDCPPALLKEHAVPTPPSAPVDPVLAAVLHHIEEVSWVVSVLSSTVNSLSIPLPMVVVTPCSEHLHTKSSLLLTCRHPKGRVPL